MRSLNSRMSVAAISIWLTGSAPGQMSDGDRENAQLRAENAALKEQIGGKWLSEERAAEIRVLVRDVLADAEVRSSLQDSGATSGYSDGFFIASADGNFRLKASLLAQARFTFNHQQSNPGAINSQEASSTWGFENRRTGMAFSGNAVDPSWTYAARFNYGSTTDPYTPEADDMILQDAWVAKDFGNGFSVKVGQFKSPFMAESLHNDGAQLTAERSVVDYYFSGGYTQGVAVGYSSDQIRAAGTYNNGPRVQNRSWTDNVNNSISIAGRFELKVMGAWSQFDSESSLGGDDSALLLGAAIQYYNNRTASAPNATWLASVASPVYTSGSLTTTGAIDWTVDATYKSGGLSASAAFVGANYGGEDYFLSGPVTKYNSYGVVLQGGYRITDALEGFGRWEWLNVANGANTPSELTLGTAISVNNLLTFGVNVYAARGVKWTTQFGISLSAVGTGIELVGAGYNPDNNTNASDQFNIITQLQVGF